MCDNKQTCKRIIMKSDHKEENLQDLKRLIGYGFDIIEIRSVYAIFKKKKHSECIIWNVAKPYDNGVGKYHTHLNNLQTAKSIVKNLELNRKPKSRTKWVLESYLRIADEKYNHYEWVSQLIQTRRHKGKEYYTNIGCKKSNRIYAK